MRRLLLILALFVCTPAAGSAQRALRRFPPPDTTRTINPGAALLASAVLPGAGQRLIGSDKWVPFLALEAWGWLTFRNHLSEGRALRQRYRDLAWSVARRVSVGERRDSVFEYYEAMAKHDRSGAFDTDPVTEGVQPELDPGTFNGEKWELARELFFPFGTDSIPHDTPQYAAAIAYYSRVAIPASYAWAWGENELEQRVFGELIHRGDEALRGATKTLGVILANHVASAIDALVTARLKQSRISPEGLQFQNGFVPGDGSLRWVTGVRIQMP